MIFTSGTFYMFSYHRSSGDKETTADLGPLDAQQAEIYYQGLKEYNFQVFTESGSYANIQQLCDLVKAF